MEVAAYRAAVECASDKSRALWGTAVAFTEAGAGAMEDARSVAIGRRVRVVFQELAEHLALVQFTLTDEPPEGRVWRLPE